MSSEPVDVAAGERRGRLVEQQDARLAEHRAGDLDLLPHREIEIADLLVEVDVVEAEAVRSVASTAARAARRWIAPKRLIGPVGSSMLSSTVRSPTSVISWNAVCTPCACASRGEPKRTAWPNSRKPPASGCTRPDSSFTNVDLPAPFSPSSACTAPRRTANDTSSTATVGP